jgi:hypothetical protein
MCRGIPHVAGEVGREYWSLSVSGHVEARQGTCFLGYR